MDPRENKIVAFLALGEGWHNYHHVFPWDYKTAEVGVYQYNLSTMFLDFFAKIGWAYDLKTVPASVVRDRVKRTGDGSHHKIQKDSNTTNNSSAESEETTTTHVWGWDDENMPAEHRKLAESARVENKIAVSG
jgi:stearoyl-CoA desaturase (delta-9 desaturase)